MLGKHHADAVDRCTDPIGRAAVADVLEQRSHRFAPGVLVGYLEDRFVGEGRAADGICAAIERVGVVLAEHFPRSSADLNEIPDKLIEL